MEYQELVNKASDALKQEICIQFPGTTPQGKVLFGCGVACKTGEQAKALGMRRVLLIADPIIVKLGMHEPVLESLQQAGIETEIFDQIQPEPHIEVMEQAAQAVRSNAFDGVIGMGGGSALDTAKTASVLAVAKGETTMSLIQHPERMSDRLPTILISTTSGTGSEVSPFAVTSTEEKKMFLNSPYLYASVALVDPILTASMPAKVTAATGLDALTHGVEGVCGKTNPFTLALTRQCAALVFRSLKRAVEDGTDLQARYDMSFASVLGMLAYNQGGGLYAHSISYILTLGKGHAHGVGCGMSLPYTLQYNKDYIPEVLKMLRSAIEESGIALQSEKDVPKAFLDLVKQVGIPANTKDAGFSEEELDQFADDLIQKYYRPLNPRKMDAQEAKMLTEAMFWESLDF